jgi:hypothetical protein
MNYNIKTTDYFEGNIKQLSKKYRSLFDDLKILKKELLENPDMGADLGDNTRKVRMAIASKNKGKRGGARVITCNVLIDVVNTKIYLLAIYDKGEQDSISKKKIAKLKKLCGLIP